MKYAAALLLSAFIISCDHSVDPEEQLVFYKTVNKELFAGELYIGVSTYTDSIRYQNGYIQTIKVPQIILSSDVKKLTFMTSTAIAVSSSLEFVDNLGGVYLAAGAHSWANGFSYTYKCKSANEKTVCIRMKSGEQVYFTVGVDLSKMKK